MIPGHLVQSVRNKTFLHQLNREVKQLQDRGQIKDDYVSTEQGQTCLQELLAILGNPPVDQRKFNVVKNIFLAAAQERMSDRDDPLPQLLMHIAGQLEAGEIILLVTCYKIAKANKGLAPNEHHSESEWHKLVIANSELSMTALIEVYERGLMDKRLLMQHGPVITHTIIINDETKSRLTDLGMSLCDFMRKGEDSRSVDS